MAAPSAGPGGAALAPLHPAEATQSEDGARQVGTALAGASGVVVYKMTGSGNDFVFVDGRATPVEFWTADRIQAVCARQTGVGADGLVVLEPGSEPSRIRLHYFNRDGFRAELCGNASLCAARLAGWIELGSPAGLVLETDAGPVRARCVEGPGELAELTLGDLSGVAPSPVEFQPGEESAHFVRVGVPHLVIRVGDLHGVDVARRGRELRHHPAVGPDGANVNFVAWEREAWGMRTYERGVEAETLACGTGAVAVAATLASTGAKELPVELRSTSGCTLTVCGMMASPGVFRDLRLVAEGRFVFRAVLGR